MAVANRNTDRSLHTASAQNLLHGLALGQFVDQLVQVADLLHQRVLHLLYEDTAHDAFDQCRVRMDERRSTGLAQIRDTVSDLWPRPTLGLALKSPERVQGMEPATVPPAASQWPLGESVVKRRRVQWAYSAIAYTPPAGCGLNAVECRKKGSRSPLGQIKHRLKLKQEAHPTERAIASCWCITFAVRTQATASGSPPDREHADDDSGAATCGPSRCRSHRHTRRSDRYRHWWCCPPAKAAYRMLGAEIESDIDHVCREPRWAPFEVRSYRAQTVVENSELTICG